jgi:hypothetical protein
MRPTEARSNQRRPRERGAALVEATVAIPLLFAFTFGFIELAGLLRAYAAAEGATRAAGRTASVAGSDPLADRAVLARLEGELGPLGADSIDYVVIWHAGGPGEAVPSACRPSTVATPNSASLGVADGGVDSVGACNVYVRPGAPGGAFGRLADPATAFGCTGPADPGAAQKLDCNWPAQHRRALTTPRTVLGPELPTDFVGVHVQLRHQHLVRLLGASSTLSESAVNLIEPLGYSV